MNTNDLWKKFLEEIADQVTIQSYNIWFKDLQLININDTTVNIQVPMDIHKSNLNQKYYQLIENIFYNLTGKNYEIKFYVKGEYQNDLLNSIPDNSFTNSST